MIKHLLLLALITISCIKSYSQIIFEKGYFIDESNKKVECLIKNIDWKNNPTEFEYKPSQNESVQKESIQNVKEFGINDVSKYIRAKINIDRASDQIKQMSSERNPSFQEEVLFLKVLIEGKASLYLYTDGDLTRFFYRLDDSEIKQLVSRRYLSDDKIFENNYFKQQLSQELKSEEIELTDIKNLNYAKRDLKILFTKYNNATNSDYIIYEPKQKNDVFNLNIRPGLKFSSLTIQNSMTATNDTDFGSNVGIRLGIELEYILPFNKNKWGLIIEPTYQNFKSEQSMKANNVAGGIIVSKVDYKSIELPIGLRHYFYLNDESKLFTNLSFIFDFPNNSTVKFFRSNDSMLSELEVKSNINLAIGAGYKYKNRYSFEIRYNTKRKILSDYLSWDSNYSSLNIILGFSILYE